MPARRSPRRSSPFALLLVGLLTWLSWSAWPNAVARADARVTVQLKDAAGQPADGVIELREAAGKLVASCRARAGHCEMPNVPGGSYAVTVTPAKGAAPKPRNVMIPPSGNVALVLSTG